MSIAKRLLFEEMDRVDTEYHLAEIRAEKARAGIPLLVVVESPYAGEVERNLIYVRRAMKDCLMRGEAPIASHALYTQPGVLDDGKPEERALGIAAGLAWVPVADVQVFYVDYGWSRGMLAARELAEAQGRPIETRTIGENT